MCALASMIIKYLRHAFRLSVWCEYARIPTVISNIHTELDSGSSSSRDRRGRCTFYKVEIHWKKQVDYV